MKTLKRTVTVTKPVQVEQAVGVSIDLTIEEYAVLRIILGKVSGGGIRRHAESLSRKLTIYDQSEQHYMAEDQPYSVADRGDYYDLMVGGVSFTDESRNNPAFQKIVDYYKDNLK